MKRQRAHVRTEAQAVARHRLLAGCYGPEIYRNYQCARNGSPGISSMKPRGRVRLGIMAKDGAATVA
jgi:hypothetical protein